ncbi:acyl-CoA dehydrogenase [Candidatus Mycobacterium wuenschmannii]|uniref:Acyl-CoA dehydrogenase n=1 Tax=Candidatus Mycobacterium wuenschmannii TaxID=3027808 RepID=A0ABY8W356_9MYCO|nr:acyl-CoA dehydrogenase [Candidatus Mycobacterium wuenschmannii]WIM88882.1 acyl-CoA dehydrogenase [Candidatus Mycobacterium wuenschmannii]
MIDISPSGHTAISDTHGRPHVDEELAEWLRRNTLQHGVVSLTSTLSAATALSERNIRPGGGRTYAYLSALVTAGFVDATVARVIEPHLDAHAILHQAGLSALIPRIDADEAATWGVFAANAAGHHLEAHRDDLGWTLSGTKPWCSLAQSLSHAVITADLPGGGSGAFAVRLDRESVTPLPARWVSRGLSEVVSTGIRIDGLPAIQVGDAGWYLTRPGFSWGAIGVAAVWFGIALGLYDHMCQQVDRRPPDQLALADMGTVDYDLFAAQLSLHHAADEIDAGRAVGDKGDILALRVRAVVARMVHNVLTVVGAALGPGPLTQDEEYARRTADLTVYVRQHHGERDLVRLAELLRSTPC